MITLTYAPEYYITDETIFRLVESRDDSDRPGTLVLEGYNRVDDTFSPRDPKKWFPLARPGDKNITPDEVAAWKALN